MKKVTTLGSSGCSRQSPSDSSPWSLLRTQEEAWRAQPAMLVFNNIDDNDASSLIMILVGEAWQWQQQWVNWSSWSFSLIGAQTWGWYDHCLVWSSLKDDDDMTSLSPSPPTTRDMLTIGFAKNFMSLYSPVNAFPCYKKVLFNKAGLETEWCQAGTVSFYRISCKACDTFYGKYNSARVKLSARVWLKYVQQ